MAIPPPEEEQGTPRTHEGRRLIKQDLIQRIAERTGLVRTKAEAAVDAIFDSMKQSLAEGDRIELRGFGVFTVKPRKTGIGPQSPDRRRSLHRARKGDPLQAREGPAGARLNRPPSAFRSRDLS